MVLKLYGYSKSTCTRLVALVCKEKEIPFEFIAVDLSKREHKTESYLKIQPFGQVPYIDDDGFILYESRAIARYLIKKYPDQGTPGLIPTDPKEEALFEQASSIEAFDFNTVVAPFAGETAFKKLRGLEPDPVKVEELRKKVETSLDVYDRILSKQKYLAGDKVTLADLQHLPYGSVLGLAGFGVLISSRPHLNRWWQDISSRRSWEAVKDGV